MAAGYDAGWMPGDAYDARRADDFLRFCEAARRRPCRARAHVPGVGRDRAVRPPRARVPGPELRDRARRVPRARPLRGPGRRRRPARLRCAHWSDNLDRALLDRADDAPTVTFMPEADDGALLAPQDGPRDARAPHRRGDRGRRGVRDGRRAERRRHRRAALVRHAPRAATTTTGSAPPPSSSSPMARVAGARRSTDGSFSAAASTPPDATVRGSAPALLLALSGRDLEGIGSVALRRGPAGRRRGPRGVRAAPHAPRRLLAARRDGHAPGPQLLEGARLHRGRAARAARARGRS